MSSPLFNILKRNLAVPDVDRGVTTKCDLPRRRSTRPEVIAGYQIAYGLHIKHGLSRRQASKKGAATSGCSWQSIYGRWSKHEVRLKEEGLL